MSGYIDGTHIAVRSPSKDAYLFVNRKSFHLINVQGMCDADVKFKNMLANWPR